MLLLKIAFEEAPSLAKTEFGNEFVALLNLKAN